MLQGIVNASCYHGFGCMQYKIGPDGVVKVIEVNPRVSTKLLGDGFVRFYVCMYVCMSVCMFVCMYAVRDWP